MSFIEDNANKIICGDSLEIMKTMPDNVIDCVITSPPYWGLRDYGVEGQLGLEKTPEEYVAKMVGIFRECKRVLKKEGTLWLNLGDSYSGSGDTGNQFGQIESGLDIVRPAKPQGFLKPKDLVGIPWRVAFALQADGWWLRQDIIWHKPNPMPESVTDRCTKSHEYIFLLSKSGQYYFDNEAIKEDAKTPGSKSGTLLKDAKEETGKISGYNHSGEDFITKDLRNKRSVWTVTTKPFREAHFATFPEDLIKPMVLAGCPKGGIVLDPFMGAGTTALVAKELNRNYVGIELNPEYIKIANKRTEQEYLSL